jgi:hypothetical protein
MNDSIKIVEQSYVLNHTIDHFEINVVSLKLNSSVSVIINCYDKFKVFLFNKLVDICGEEYLAWGNDDEYLITLISSKLGFTLQPSA